MVLFSYNNFPVLHIFPTADGIAVNARYVAVGAEVAARESDAVHVVQVDVLVESAGAEVVFVDGEGAVAEAAVVGLLAAVDGRVVG